MKTNLLKSIFISLILVMGVSNAWAYTAHFSLMGDPVDNDWKNDRDFMINTGTGTTDEWYIYAYVATNQYFALNNGSSQYGPSSNGKEIKQNTGEGQGSYNTNSWKFTGTSGIIKICCAESQNREWYPWVWVEESAPIIKFKHPWNGGSWSEQTATKQNDGTYTYDGKYGNNEGFNAGPSGKYKYNASQTTVEGSPATGDMCRFIWNPVGYVQGGAETKASGTFKIVKLCSLTYDGNGKTGGTVPSATNNQLYNTSITLSSNTLTKAGYTHTGWNTKADGTGDHYDKGASYTLTAVSTTLYAEWTPAKYTITYKDQGGSNFSGTHESGYPTTHTYGTATTLKTASKTGYTFEGWYKEPTCTNKVTSLGATAYSANITLYAKWTANTYTVHFDKNANEATGSMDDQVFTYGEQKELTKNAFIRDKYSFVGWATTKDGEKAYDDQSKVSNLSSTDGATVTLYAKWELKATYAITLDQTGAKTEGTTSVTATLGDPMPAIASLPTPADGYAFMGYWDGKDGSGTQYYNAAGESVREWNQAKNTTLYAYFKKAELTSVTLDETLFDSDEIENGETSYVTVTSAIEPTPAGIVVVCWTLCYNNGTPVEEHNAIEEDGTVKFSLEGLSAGTYKVVASLRLNDCNGEILDTEEATFVITGSYTVTIKYTCDGKEIAGRTTEEVHATNPSEVTAADIGGYNFVKWELGDGISTTDALTGKTINITASYEGYLTATYEKKMLIFLDVSKLPNRTKWTKPHIYLYKEGGYWDKDKGAGSKSGGNFIKDTAMVKVPNTTGIWYYEYAHVKDFGGVVAFTSEAQTNFENFHNCEAIYRTDFTSGTPMFVPTTIQEPEKKNNNATSYYNKGYWVKYMDGTGYELRIYNQISGDNTQEVVSVPLEFTTSAKMPMSAIVDLEAGKTYGFKIYRADGKWYGNTGTMTNSSHTKWAFTEKYWDNEEEKTTPNCGLTTGVSGDYTFTLIYDESSTNQNDFEYRVTVDYPASVGDYRIIYKDNNEINWSGNPKPDPDDWVHPSRIIKKAKDAKDIVSFFIDPKASPTIQYQSIKSVANNGKVTWNPGVNLKLPEEIKEAGVYNLVITQTETAINLEHVEPYTGNYYIRVDAADGKWYDYKTNPDNLMTYSAFSESDANSFGEKFSHYKTKWCPRGINVKFVIANDYSLCISDTITRDLIKASGVGGEDYMTEGGDLYQEDGGSKDPVDDRYSANIRFMWNRKTNKISRAYLASSSNDSRQFLVLKGCQEIKDENGNNLSGNGDNHGECRALLQDTQDWIYERTFKVQPGTRVKLYACYANTTVSPAKAQYFRGAYDSNQCGSAENSVQILGGSNKTEWEKIRVIYDFKTNRLIGAWVPSGEISETQTIAADVMIMRNHQKDATCITLAEGKSLNSVKTVYGALRFNRWTLNNKDANTHKALSIEDQKTIYERALFFISFPFDVHLSDAFGLGTYGTHWVISTYNGKRRAERGYFAEDCINEDCTNWDYIWDPTDFVMEANVGYLLSLDLELMKDNDESFWPNNINYRELLFPSQVELATITKTNYTMPELGSKYECTINLNTDGTQPERDRRVKDSYWRCIGVPSFADYSGLLKDGSDKSITWQPAGGNLPFLYEWNVTNNNLVVRSATNYRFRPTFAYLIQNGGAINWTLVSTKPNPIIARERSEATSNYEWKIALLRNGNTEDQTFVRVTDDETVTAAFDFHQDLSKEFNYGANIYTLVGYERLAANSLPMSNSTTIIPLGVSAQEAGDYTITMPEGVESIGITLVDNETGIHTNLSAGQEYTLTLNKGICENRLFIEVSPIQNTPTDLEYTTEDTREQTTRKVLIDGKLIIRTAEGEVFDAQGHRL